MIKPTGAGRIRKGICSHLRQVGVFLAVIASIFFSLPAQARDFQDCKRCHQVILDQMFRVNLHLPFLQRRCGKCHSAKVVADAQQKKKSKKLKGRPGRLEDRRKIHWLGESLMADTRHGFVLPGENAGDILTIEVQGNDGEFSREILNVPPLADLPEVEDNGKPPAISNVQVLEVLRGVFLSATIGWQTDTLTDARVIYGEKDLQQTTQLTSRLGQRHEVHLSNLKPDRTYRFSVISKDLFGREQASDPLSFSTSRPLEAPLPVTAGSLQARWDVPGLTTRFERIGSDFLLELALEQPSSVYVGTREGASRQSSLNGSSGAMENPDRFHEGLSSRQVSSMEACRGCHKGQSTATHPVNVYPKPGMIIPPEYPTLADGRITCRSCHESHSSDYKYLTIKKGKRELCVGCHKDMI